MEDGGGWVDDREFTWACWELRESMENEELSLAERDADVAEMVQLAKGATHTRNIFWDCYTGTAALLIPDTEKTAHWLKQAAEQETAPAHTPWASCI